MSIIVDNHAKTVDNYPFPVDNFGKKGITTLLLQKEMGINTGKMWITCEEFSSKGCSPVDNRVILVDKGSFIVDKQRITFE